MSQGNFGHCSSCTGKFEQVHARCSGKAFSKLMKKHKGLLRVDLRSNAGGLSGVLQMMKKGSSRAVAPAASPAASSRRSPSTGALGHAQIGAEGNVLPGRGAVTEGLYSACQHDISPPLAVGETRTDQRQLGFSVAGAVGSEDAKRREGQRLVISQKTSRKGLVPTFTPDSQHTAAQTDKENQEAGNSDIPAELAYNNADRAIGKAARAKKALMPQAAKPAGKAQVRAQHARQQGAAGSAGFEFEPLAQLRSQPTAQLNHFAAFAGASTVGPEQDEEVMATGCIQRYETDGLTFHSALQNGAAGSATFGDWKASAEHAPQPTHQPQPVVFDSFAAPQVGRPRQAGVAGSARRTVSFQEHDLQEEVNLRRAEQGNASDLASDPAYLQGMSQAWREVEAAEDLGRQRAAADSEQALHHIGTPLTDYYAPESVAAAAAAADSSGADLTKAPVSSLQQKKHARPSAAHPGGRQSVKQSNGAATQQGIGHGRTAPKAFCQEAPMTNQPSLKAEAKPRGAESSEYSTESRSAATREDAAVSGLPDQAVAAAAAAMEAAKLNVWKAEAMCEIEGLKCSLEGAAVIRHRYVQHEANAKVSHYYMLLALHLFSQQQDSQVCKYFDTVCHVCLFAPAPVSKTHDAASTAPAFCQLQRYITGTQHKSAPCTLCCTSQRNPRQDSFNSVHQGTGFHQSAVGCGQNHCNL